MSRKSWAYKVISIVLVGALPVLGNVVSTNPTSTRGGGGGISFGGASGGTATRVLFSDGSGNLSDDADLTFVTDTLTATKIGSTTLTGTNVATGRNTFGTAADAANAIDFGVTVNCITGEGTSADAFEGQLCFGNMGLDTTTSIPHLAATQTIALLEGTQTFSGAKTFTGNMSVPGAGANSTCVGTSCVASGAGSTALGVSCSAGNTSSVCVGKSGSANGARAIAIGEGATAGSSDCYVIGYNAVCPSAATAVIGGGDNGVDIANIYIGGGATSSTVVDLNIRATGGEGTNAAAADMFLAAGPGTGTGAGGNVIMQTAPSLASGTTAQTLESRSMIIGKQFGLTDNTIATFAVVTMGNDTVGGGTIHYCIRAADATDEQVECGTVDFAGVDITAGAGGETCSNPTKVGTPLQAVSAGTLTTTFAATTGTDLCNLRITADTSLTPTTLWMKYSVVHNSGQTITPQ